MLDFLSGLWKTLFFNPFLNLLMLFYAVLGDNLGLAVIVMAVVIRIILLPFTKRQTKMTQKMAGMKPKLDEIQKKYKNNPDELAKQQMALYKDSGYNPVGCLGSFIPQMLILAAIFGVIRTLSAGDFSGLYPMVNEFVFPDGVQEIENTQFLIWDLSLSFSSFEGLSLFARERWPYILLAAMVGLAQYVSTYFTQTFQSLGQDSGGTNPDSPMSQQEMTAQMGKSMILIFPLMTAYFTLNQPSILGVYWFVQAITLVLQYFVIDRDRSMGVYRKLKANILGKFGIATETTNITKKKSGKQEDVKEVEAVKLDPVEEKSEDEKKKSTEKKKKKKKKKKKRKNKK